MPNGCGSVLGAMQLTLYAINRNHKGAATGEEEPVEMSKAKTHINSTEKTEKKAQNSVANQVEQTTQAGGQWLPAASC
ncbi:putative bidirectional sugar transporter SWEET1a [Cocos nucifera]|nr:putative bidirectional sugar transporter SWEET1a [Cocos nucifera]